ncbi:zinc-binding dehydrogenase [Kribbella sandramycini]|uniref:NADPH2:quinone reductase n=1 Tax=Kribbella sandramycini TaxID=60450 RepID=A0A7Y4P4L4_9ACTN|nr:zinc-binding dehydrogenase [Kribbella sandramycini]MBB6570474.1 NADPH2:quinone reductase [Kribbella sandramycini]NOL45334.1 zinc-binding dehydrogenase [Kribbella sandramycini]
MRAAVVTEFGDATVIRTQEWPDPEPAAGQVVVEVELADIMWVDTAIRRGMHGSFFAVEPPYVPGALFGGRVSAAGPDVPAEWVGKTVVGRSAAFGAHAELVVADIGAVTELPPGVDLAAAVAASGDGMTALMLEELAPAMQGKDVLITAAAGAMGLLLIQLAHRAGARVVAAARGEAKLELSKTQGADVVVDYSEPGWEKAVLAATGDRGVDIVFDGAGGAFGAAAFGVVKDGGWISAHGAPGGGFAPVDPAEAERRGVTLKGIMDLRADSTTTTVTGADVVRRVAAGDLVPVVDQVFDLDHVADAHTALEQRTLLGKALIRVR